MWKKIHETLTESERCCSSSRNWSHNYC